MPYKDKEAKKEYQKELMRKKRGSNIKGLTESGLTEGVTNYVIPMTRKAAIEITKANRGNSGALTGDVKRKVFSALHNMHDCRYLVSD